MRIDIDENEQPTPTAIGHALLRTLIGLVMIGHGYLKLQQFQALQAQLADLAVPSTEAVAYAWIGLEMLAGICLIVGRLTRFGAFLALCEASAALTIMLWHKPLVAAWRPELEPPVLLAAAAIYFLCAGSGRFGADVVLKRRARIKALIEDELWQRPPYVSRPEGRYDEGAYSRRLNTL